MTDEVVVFKKTKSGYAVKLSGGGGKEMNDSPRHNVGSIKDPHWVVDEEHYLKAVADADHFFSMSGQYLARANEAEAQRDKAVEMLRFMRDEYASLPHSLGYTFTHLPKIDDFLKECGNE